MTDRSTFQPIIQPIMKIRPFLITCFTLGILAIPLIQAVAAQDGVLSARDPKSQINLRESPDPNSQRLGYGLVGDRVEVLEQVPGADDYTWYRVRFYQSGAEGWIRNDFVQIVPGSSNAGSNEARYQNGYNQGYQTGYRDGQNARRYNAGYQPEKFIQAGSGNVDPEYDRGFRAGFFAGFDAGYNGSSTAASSNGPTNGTVLSFQTPSNAVRIFNRSGQTYMNVFDKRKSATWLNGVPVAIEQAGNGTYYRYQGEVTVVVFDGNDGTRSLDINGDIETGA